MPKLHIISCAYEAVSESRMCHLARRLQPPTLLTHLIAFSYKLSSHVALLQVDQRLQSKDERQFLKESQFAKVAFPPDVIGKLAGGSIVRNDGIMDDHFSLSGKMKVLAKLLRKYNKNDDRVLIFSYSTQTLDLIQNYVRSAGYKHLRMDGQTSATKREELLRQFKEDISVVAFLLSTKAMGLGLNLTVSAQAREFVSDCI